MTPHERLAALYRGRTDCWGAVHGEQVKRPLTLDDWYEHVYGAGSVGVYPIVPRNDGFEVAWCGVDIDEGDDRIGIAINVQRVLHHLGLPAWVERSKTKGFHTLCFIDGWVPAVTARAAMLVACKAAQYQPKEVYPKQTRLAEGAAGNYLNAAYSKTWAANGRRVMLNANGSPYGLYEWLHLAEDSLCAPVTVHDVAAMWVEPVRHHVTVGAAYQGGMKDLTDKLSPLAWTIFNGDPLPDKHTGRVDRSGELSRLARFAARDGLNPSEVLALVRDRDMRFDPPKFAYRADADQRYSELVERAY